MILTATAPAPAMIASAPAPTMMATAPAPTMMTMATAAPTSEAPEKLLDAFEINGKSNPFNTQFQQSEYSIYDRVKKEDFDWIFDHDSVGSRS